MPNLKFAFLSVGEPNYGQPNSASRDAVLAAFFSECTQIKLEEPKWLSGGSHTSVFNGGLMGSHFGSPRDPDTCIHVSGSPGI